MPSPVWFVPLAILSSAAIGFLAAWYTGLLNRQRIATSELVSELCNTIDRFREIAVEYWMEEGVATSAVLKREQEIYGLTQSINLQVTHLKVDLKAWKPRWWAQIGIASTSTQRVDEALIQMFMTATGGDYGAHKQRPPDFERCRRIISTAERLKFTARSERRRY